MDLDPDPGGPNQCGTIADPDPERFGLTWAQSHKFMIEELLLYDCL